MENINTVKDAKGQPLKVGDVISFVPPEGNRTAFAMKQQGLFNFYVITSIVGNMVTAANRKDPSIKKTYNSRYVVKQK